MTTPPVGASANLNNRALDRGWRDRHIQGQRDGTLPPGKIQMRHEDGTLVTDRIGRPRMWSPHVEAATRPRPAGGWHRPGAPGAEPGAHAPVTPALRVPVGKAATRADLAADPRVVTARISRTPPAPVVRPPSSREIARRKAKAEEAARNAEAARALRASVQKGIRPLPGKAFSVDVGARLLIGPAGAVGTSERLVRTLEPLAAGGRHPAAVLVAAGAWPSETALIEALVAVGGKLAAVGLRIDRRKAGVRMAKARP